MDGLQTQASWRAPRSNTKLHETRTFTRVLETPSDWGTDFFCHKRLQFDAGHSIGHPSSWSLVIVACGNHSHLSRQPSSVRSTDSNFIGLFLDNLHNPTEHAATSSKSDDGSEDDLIQANEFIANYKIEVIEHLEASSVILSRTGETPPRSKITEGFWGWRKVSGIPFEHLEGPIQLRITFTLIGRRKDELTKIPSSHINLLAKKHSAEEDTAKVLYSLIKDPKKPDAEIKCHAGKIFHVHKEILGARSPVFLRMFECGMTESKTQKVVIHELRNETLDYVLRHLYTGQVEIEWLTNPQIASELVYASEKYWLESLRSFCDKYLVHAANSINCLRLLELASLHDLQNATDDLQRYVHERMRRRGNLISSASYSQPPIIRITDENDNNQTQSQGEILNV